MTDTFLDGGGVLPDEPLPCGTWLRLNLGSPAAAIRVRVDGEGLRISGHYLPLSVVRLAPNELRVEPRHRLASARGMDDPVEGDRRDEG